MERRQEARVSAWAGRPSGGAGRVAGSGLAGAAGNGGGGGTLAGWEDLKFRGFTWDWE
jgi:hypothetical protein